MSEQSEPKSRIESRRKTCEASHCTMAFLVIFCVVGGIASVVFGVMVAKPGLLSLNFKNATCKVTAWRFITKKACDCSGLTSDDPYCRSKFPCYQITVAYQPWRRVITYNESSDDSFKLTGMIRESDTDFSSTHNECSFHTCHRDYAQNRLRVENFRKKYGKLDQFYLCQYNPENENQVVIKTRFNETYVLLAIIVPLLVFIVSLVGLVSFCLVLNCRKSKKSNHDGQRLERRYLGRDMPVFEPDEACETPITITNGKMENARETEDVKDSESGNDPNVHNILRDGDISQPNNNLTNNKTPEMSTAM